MDLPEFARRVNAVDWHQFDGPAYYNAEKMGLSLVALAEADTEDHSGYAGPADVPPILMNGKIVREVQGALTNERTDSFTPATFKAVEFIAEVAVQGNTAIARNCAIDVLIDLYLYGVYSTYPAEAIDAHEKEQQLKAAIAAYSTPLAELAKTEGEINRRLIEEFLEIQQE